MQHEIKTLISAQQIQKRVQEIAEEINRDYQNEELVLVCILRGAFLFTADLARYLHMPVQCEFLQISSYGNSKISSGKVTCKLDVSPETVQGKHVMIVEDIIDTGNSMVFLQQHLREMQPASVKVCSFLLKEKELKNDIFMDYIGYVIDSLFVIGYGLDYAGLYRNLPYIGVVVDEDFDPSKMAGFYRKPGGKTSSYQRQQEQ